MAWKNETSTHRLPVPIFCPNTDLQLNEHVFMQGITCNLETHLQLSLNEVYHIKFAS